MTADEIITGILDREGGWRDAVQRPDGSWDPATNMGVTLPTARDYFDDPNYSEDQLRRLTPEQARDCFQMKYIESPGFTAEAIPFEPLRVQLIDFGVNSGPARTIRWLQRVLGFSGAAVDGVLGPDVVETLRRLDDIWDNDDLRVNGLALVNDALVTARSYMIRSAVASGSIRKEDHEGLQRRALGFFLARP